MMIYEDVQSNMLTRASGLVHLESIAQEFDIGVSICIHNGYIIVNLLKRAQEPEEGVYVYDESFLPEELTNEAAEKMLYDACGVLGRHVPDSNKSYH